MSSKHRAGGRGRDEGGSDTLLNFSLVVQEGMITKHKWRRFFLLLIYMPSQNFTLETKILYWQEAAKMLGTHMLVFSPREHSSIVIQSLPNVRHHAGKVS